MLPVTAKEKCNVASRRWRRIGFITSQICGECQVRADQRGEGGHWPAQWRGSFTRRSRPTSQTLVGESEKAEVWRCLRRLTVPPTPSMLGVVFFPNNCIVRESKRPKFDERVLASLRTNGHYPLCVAVSSDAVFKYPLVVQRHLSDNPILNEVHTRN